MWVIKKQYIIEAFPNGNPKLIHITKNILGNKILIRSIEFWENGNKKYDKKYKNGRPEGKQLFYTENGERTEQWIKNGKRNGIYTQWNSNNEIILKEKWKEGKRIKTMLNINNY
jgi:antitoxin component YwqK of YwqJK toxin-antitoxin module